MLSLEKRFLDYISYDTQSDSSAVGIRRPTTEGQERLLKHLGDELEALGLDVYYGQENVVMGKLKGTCSGKCIAFMAHVDTSDETAGNGVKPIVNRAYDGGSIALPYLTITPEDEPDLLLYKGSTIITSDGSTLLGADDKAGCAIIIEALSRLVSAHDSLYPDIEVFFTPDEETGSGMDRFPIERMKAEVCYTIDGGREGEIEAGCFNAASVVVRVQGTPYHPGYGRGKLVNALSVMSRIISLLPQAESPEATDGSYGYYYPSSIRGSAAEAEAEILVRDFSFDSLEKRIDFISGTADAIAAMYHAKSTVESSITYRNMRDTLAEKPEALCRILKAGEKLGMPLYVTDIRGGTDGAWLSERGIPSPNIFTGGHAFHSNSEWIALDAMERSVDLVLGIIREAICER